jgi:endoglucanase
MVARGGLWAGAAVAATAALGLGFGAHAHGGTSATAFVRVDQVGYPSGAPKRAYLMSSEDESGATFTVRSSDGTALYTAPIGQARGAWSARYPFVYPLDFGQVHGPASVTIDVSGPVAASSPPFPIDSGPKVYAGALANALFFYQAERDGPHYIPSALRTAPGHLNDEHAMTYLTPVPNDNDGFKGKLTPLGKRIDASGGWWDAGDYPKFVETTSYTVALMLLGVRDFPGQLGARSKTSNFTAEARFGTDFLLRMWDDSTRTLYYQVGIGEGNSHYVGDHDIWRLPQADDTWGGSDPSTIYIRHRPVFRAGPPGSPVSPNLAGRDAAAFALCYQVFRERDPALARRCLLSAEHIYDLADTSPTGDLLTVFTFDFYPETEWKSDLELGAVELYDALAASGGSDLPAGLAHTDPSYYLRQASHWANAYIHSPDDAADTLNLYDVAGAAHYELYRALEADAGATTGLETTRADLLADLLKQLSRGIAQASTDPFQFGFTWPQWDTTSHGAGLAVLASEVDELTHTRAYANWSSRWLANIFGANAWGVSLVVGDGTTFPHCMQHQVANLAGSLDGTPPILRGAVVEGPNGEIFHGIVDGMRLCPADGVDVYKPFDNKAIFKDDVQSFSTVEPAIDLGASLPLALARQAAGRY